MQRTFMLLLAAGLFTAVVAGCASQAVGQITPAQYVQAACGPVQDALDLVPDFADTIPDDVAKKVSDAQPLVDKFCAAGATISFDTVLDFANTVLPAADAVVQAAPASLLSNDRKLQIGGAILLAELAVKTVTAIAQNEAALATSAADAAPASSADTEEAPAQ
jgi:hypothetical protein